MIEISELTKTYGKKRGINGISFKIYEGEIVGFLGPNGAGKTTTMNIITGYLSANSGTAKVADIDILENPIAAKKHIGYLPEQPPLYVDMTVDEYLNFIYNIKNARNIRREEHIREIVGMIGLENHRKRLIRNLSKGYRQRVGLAQALIGNPDVLILDEPTVGLDPKQIIEIRNVIKELGKNRTIILSTHILQEVEAICERVLVISEGNIVADDTVDNLSAVVTGDRKLSVRVAGPQNSVRRALRSVDGVLYAEAGPLGEPGAYDYIVEARPNVDVRKPMFTALARAGYPILELKNMDLSLEDIFIKLTAEKKKAYSPGNRPKKDQQKQEEASASYADGEEAGEGPEAESGDKEDAQS